MVYNKLLYQSIFFILFLTSFIVYISKPNEVPPPNEEIKSNTTISEGNLNFTEEFECLETFFKRDWEEGFFIRFDEYAFKCTSKLFYSLPILTLGVPRKEMKYFLRPRNTFDTCNVITLGIGREIEVEEDLRRILPQCTFLGVDPDQESNIDLFTKELHGKFVKGAVGKTAGVQQGFIRDSSGKYSNTLLNHIGFKDLLLEHNGKEKMIDMIYIDIEGGEFDVMDIIINDLEQLPLICQLYIEIHTVKDPEAKKPHVIEQFYLLLTRRKYLLLKSFEQTVQHFHKTFWLNSGSSDCRQKYLL